MPLNCQNSRRLIPDDRGAIGLIAGLTAPLLLGFAAFGHDVGSWYFEKQQLQSAADLSAAGAASAARAGGSDEFVEAVAVLDLERNGYDVQSQQLDVQLASADREVSITLSKPLDGLFSSSFLPADIEISASSTAGWTAGVAASCVLALDEDAQVGIAVDNVGRISAPDCQVHSNAPTLVAGRVNNPTGSIVLNSGAITAEPISSSGEFALSNSGSNTVNGSVQNLISVVADPLASVPEPAVGVCNKPGNYTSWTPLLNLSPGVYCSGLKIQNVPKVVFAPGLYVIRGGNMEVNNAVMEGDGVSFFLNNGALVIQNYSGTSTLTSASTGDQAGILFFQSHANGGAAGTSHFRGGSVMNFEGAIYLPEGDLVIDNNAQVTVSGANATAIASTIKVRGSAQLAVTTGDSSSSTVASRGKGGSRRLVR